MDLYKKAVDHRDTLGLKVAPKPQRRTANVNRKLDEEAQQFKGTLVTVQAKFEEALTEAVALD